MSHFDAAFAAVKKIEGGYVNHARDRGGATNHGITLATLSSYMGKPATEDDIKSLTELDAKRIYFVLYWEKPKFDLIQDERLACVLFDQAVNRGPSVAIRNMQKMLNKIFPQADLVEDGILGARSAQLMNGTNVRALALNYLEQCQLDYVRIVEHNPSQISFLRGWLSRIHLLQRMFWVS